MITADINTYKELSGDLCTLRKAREAKKPMIAGMMMIPNQPKSRK
jgi:hypothetical protein